MRVALGLEYDGSQFHGWQVQKHEPKTVQAAVEAALSSVANEPVRVVCAGRTDSGVHAAQQVIHFDTVADRDQKAWCRGVNTLLPDAIAIKWATVVRNDFHARFSAKARTYQYTIYNRPERPGLLRPYLTWFYQPLDASLMAKAAEYLLGEQDFTSLRAKDCQSRTAWRCVHSIAIERQGPFIRLTITANAFLKHMVRNIVGLLVMVGQHKEPPEWVRAVLAAKDRTRAGVTAPPHGLSLMSIEYPSDFNLPLSKPHGVPLGLNECYLA